jgi:hypothetical protein
MRILLVAAAALVAPAAAAPPAPAEPTAAQKAPAECRTSSVHQASPFKRGDPVRPKNLGELPPATGYKAVLRTIDGCDAPLTLVEYQRATGR